MKITKNQLRRIIREEKAKVLAEQKVRRIVRRRLLEKADYAKVSPLLDKLMSRPGDEKVRDQLITLVQQLGSSEDVNMAVDALYAIDDAGSRDEMADAADSAIDYVRQAYGEASPQKSAAGPELEFVRKNGPLSNMGFDELPITHRYMQGGDKTDVEKLLGAFRLEGHPAKMVLSVEKLSQETGVAVPASGNAAQDAAGFLKSLEAAGIDVSGVKMLA